MHHDQWTGAAQAPLTASNPVTMLTGPIQHIFYRGADGNINRISYDGSFHRDQWTVLARTPRAAGKPALMLTGN
jgi:hypothetical protein